MSRLLTVWFKNFTFSVALALKGIVYFGFWFAYESIILKQSAVLIELAA
jgi:hypothetical protein